MQVQNETRAGKNKLYGVSNFEVGRNQRVRQFFREKNTVLESSHEYLIQSLLSW